MSNITLFVLVSFALLSIYLLWKNMLLRERLDELEEECYELDRIGNKYKAMYHNERVLNAFAEPLEK